MRVALKKYSVPIFLIVFVAFVILQVFLTQSSPEFEEPSEKAIVLVSTEFDLSIYSFEQKKVIPISVKARNHGGGIEFGDSGPQTSPDLLNTAYIDNVNLDLWILNHKTLKSKKVLANNAVQGYITGWSPDSKKLLYVTGTNHWDGEGDVENKKLIPEKSFSENKMYLYDLKANKSEEIVLPGHFYQFMDENRILVFIEEEDEYQENPPVGIYNLNDEKVEKILDNVEVKKLSLCDISENEKFNACVHNFNNGNNSEIVYMKFTQTEGTAIDTGSWGDLQSPLLSPHGVYVAYEKRIGDSNIALNQETWVYSIKNKSTKNYGIGTPVRWVSDTELIFEGIDEDLGTSMYSLIHVETEKMDLLFKPDGGVAQEFVSQEPSLDWVISYAIPDGWSKTVDTNYLGSITLKSPDYTPDIGMVPFNKGASITINHYKADSPFDSYDLPKKNWTTPDDSEYYIIQRTLVNSYDAIRDFNCWEGCTDTYTMGGYSNHRWSIRFECQPDCNNKTEVERSTYAKARDAVLNSFKIKSQLRMSK